MTPWMLATIAMLPPAAAALLATARGDTGQRLVALQLGTALAAFVLALMTFAFDQPSFIDLALVLSLLSLPGTMLIAVFIERWL